MRSFAITQYGEPLQCIDADPPEPVGTQVLLKVRAAGVCHTDLHIWEGGYDMGSGRMLRLADRGQTLPHTMGHETVGEVLEIGSEAKGVSVGETHLIYPWIGCGTCAVCRADTEQLCPTPQYLGVFRPGGYADFITVPHPRYLIDIGSLSPERAASYACSGLTTFSALKKLGSRIEEPVLIIGAGGLGLMCIALHKALGGLAVVVADVDPAKRQAALDAGAAAAIDPMAEDAAGQIAKAIGGPLWSIIDFVGSPSSWAMMMGSISKGGVYVMVGLFGGETVLSLPAIPLRAITVSGSFVGSRPELIELMRLVGSGRVGNVPITTRPLQEVNAAMTDLRDGHVLGRGVLIP